MGTPQSSGEITGKTIFPTVGRSWTVPSHELRTGAGDIVTKKQYDAFELSLEYQISKAGNSGVMFHVQENNNAPWHTGPEIQVQDNVDGP